MISHDKEFWSALCTEIWNVENFRLQIEGERLASYPICTDTILL